MKNFKYTALIDNGSLLYSRDTARKIQEFISVHEGAEIEIEMTSDFSRSAMQNRFWHGIVLPAVQKALVLSGMPNANDTEFVREVILKKPYLTVNHGTPNEYIRSTASLTVEEFWRFTNFSLELLIRIGGELTGREAEEYNRIVKRFKLEKVVDGVLQ